MAGNGALPMFLLSRNPNVKSLKDFSSADKIAVPTIRVSTQALVMTMAAEKLWGVADAHKLDAYTVALGHPDAFIALESGKDVNAHFSLPPFQYQELKIPGVHMVLNSIDVTGGPPRTASPMPPPSSTTRTQRSLPRSLAAMAKR